MSEPTSINQVDREADVVEDAGEPEPFSCAQCRFNATKAGIQPMPEDEVWCSYGYRAVHPSELQALPAQDGDWCDYDLATWEERVAEINIAIATRKAAREAAR